MNNFSVRNLSGLTRAGLELVYAAQEVKTYTSQFIEVIYDSDGSTVITDPIACNKQTVLNELAELARGGQMHKA